MLSWILPSFLFLFRLVNKYLIDQVIGVEPEDAAGMTLSSKAGQVITLPTVRISCPPFFVWWYHTSYHMLCVENTKVYSSTYYMYVCPVLHTGGSVSVSDGKRLFSDGSLLGKSVRKMKIGVLLDRKIEAFRHVLSHVGVCVKGGTLPTGGAAGSV